VHESLVSLQLSAQFPSPSAPGHGFPVLTLHEPEALHLSVPLQKMPSLHGVLAARLVHVPGEVPLHVWQSFVPPAHALVQQTLSTHVSALHIPVREH